MDIILTNHDITQIETEAIVNAANQTLLGGGGVDGCIHFAAGNELLEECKKLGGCKTGEAKITKGYNLPVKYIIHTVGAVYGRENGKENELLYNCYLNSLLLAEEHNIKSIAFPQISTGVFRFPKELASDIAIKATKDFIKKTARSVEKIIFVSFWKRDLQDYRNALANNLLNYKELDYWELSKYKC